MKTLLATLAAAAVSIAAVAPVAASGHERGYKKPAAKHTGARFYGRAHSVDHNGLCKRDTGTPTSELNFRNKCDVEEYWSRVLDGSRRR